MIVEHGAPPARLLLGRAEFAGDLAVSAASLADRRILVTGAGGSVGWPLTHVLSRAGLAALIAVDHHEHSLFSLERSLRGTGDRTSFELLDLRDGRRLARTFERWRPDVIFHLAAAKHVPYGERFPEGVVEANILVTDALLDLADRFGVETFVYPSSDKSVQPPSLYGATKRVCEARVQHWARSRRTGLVARFVNIVGTRGSVIETFAQQVQAGAPLTVTDDRMTRYWISMDEALWLLLETARLGQAGDVLMPDCGEPVPVVETARRLAEWYCSARSPYPIDVTGIRPGERLHEVLLSANEWFEPGPAPGLRRVLTRRDPACLDGVPAAIEALRRAVDSGDAAAARSTAMSAAEALQ